MKIGSKNGNVKWLQRAINKIYHLGLQEDGIYGKLTEEAVEYTQTQAGLKADGIAGPATIAFLMKAYIKADFESKGSKSAGRRINEIIVHCTATPDGREYTVADIRGMHIKRGFSDIGYHYIVHLDGFIETGRDVSMIGAHAIGHNTNSIGIAYIGGVEHDAKTPKDTRTQTQKEALTWLLGYLKKQYPNARICGHRDVIAEDIKKGKLRDGKACPCFDAIKEYADIG